MKKIRISLPVFFALALCFLSLRSQPKTIDGDPIKFRQIQTNSKKELFDLTVTCLSDLQLHPGDNLIYNIKLTNLLGPVANAEVKINDPIDRICSFITTGTDGNAHWTKQIPKNAKPQIYVIEFFYENAKEYSNIAVSTAFTSTKLPSYSLDLDVSKNLNASSIVLGNRGGFSPTLQTIEMTVKEAVTFGNAVAKDFLSSNTNKSVLVVGGISCIAAPGNPVCVAAITYSLKSVISSELKIFRQKIIEATVDSKETRELINNILDLGDIAISVSLLKPGEGLVSNLDAISLGEEFIKNAYNQYSFIDNNFRWASFAAQKKGSNDVYLMCIYNRDKRAQVSVPHSKDSKCKENYTGDFCFQNNTNLDLKGTFWSSPSKTRSYTSAFTCTLQPGQRQCFYDVPGGPARYEISNAGFINVSGGYYAEGPLYVDTCRQNTFFINLDTPSYSTNIPLQTNEQTTQKSKDQGCKGNYNGDYCFQNNTTLDLKITLWSSPSKTKSYTSAFTCTMQPGQRQCFFDVPAGAARYEISNASFIKISGGYYAEGSLYVDPCQENTFLINQGRPSYSTNIPLQISGQSNQISKDYACKENNDGDFCFQNDTGLDLKVTFWSSPSKTRSYTSAFTCTIQPGQRQCFFDVPAGAARYEITNGGFINVSKPYFAEGSLYVDFCREATFIIK